jgi:hypothetical protein
VSPMRVFGVLVLTAAAGALLAGCGERPQVVTYKQGTYQGKPDTPPYDAQFKGNRQEWENAIRTRNQAQNEYRRTN